jgi:hypothetical protein
MPAFDKMVSEKYDITTISNQQAVEERKQENNERVSCKQLYAC